MSSTGTGTITTVTPEELFKAYQPFVFRRARKLTKSVQEAEDIVGMVYEKVVRAFRREGFVLKDSPQAWIGRIVTNAVIDTTRSAYALHPTRSLDREEEGIEEPEEPLWCDPAEYDFETVPLLRQALARLPEKDQLVLKYYLRDYSHPEISAATGLSLCAVKMAVMRAKGRLRAQYLALEQGLAK